MGYLRSEGFADIRALVPVAAMSAGTMMALSCNEILMGNHSQLGPIDPQFTLQTPDGPRSSPAQAILDQFDRAKVECAANPSVLNAWLPILRSYGPGLLSQCKSAQDLAESMVAEAMAKHMFSSLDAPEAEAKAKPIAEWFNDHKQHLSHGRPLSFEEVHAQGVRVSLFEEDRVFQDQVLSAWHGVQHSLTERAVNKIIENQEGKAWIVQGSPGLVVVGQQPGPPPATPRPLLPVVPTQPPGGNRAARRRAAR
jgi:hypothetical protein